MRVLLKVFQRLVDAGHSVLVIEHNLDVMKSADWIIDLGPDAGDQGGRIVAAGTPEQVAACPASHTGKALRPAPCSVGDPGLTAPAIARAGLFGPQFYALAPPEISPFYPRRSALVLPYTYKAHINTI